MRLEGEREEQFVSLRQRISSEVESQLDEPDASNPPSRGDPSQLGQAPLPGPFSTDTTNGLDASVQHACVQPVDGVGPAADADCKLPQPQPEDHELSFAPTSDELSQPEDDDNVVQGDLIEAQESNEEQEVALVHRAAGSGCRQLGHPVGNPQECPQRSRAALDVYEAPFSGRGLCESRQSRAEDITCLRHSNRYVCRQHMPAQPPEALGAEEKARQAQQERQQDLVDKLLQQAVLQINRVVLGPGQAENAAAATSLAPPAMVANLLSVCPEQWGWGQGKSVARGPRGAETVAGILGSAPSVSTPTRCASAPAGDARCGLPPPSNCHVAQTPRSRGRTN